jgi:ufm1-conjugating enzyme 1
MSNVTKLPTFTVNASPLDPKWPDRLREELVALITLVEEQAERDADWFQIEPTDETGIEWSGTCWVMYGVRKFTFKVQFEIPAAYPAAPIEIELPELDGKTVKMYRGGKICMDIHFAPEWRANAPKYGIVHAMTLALGPWLAAEIPQLVESGAVKK